MKIKTSKKVKIVTLSSIVILLCFTIALSAIGIFFSKRKQNPTSVENVNPSEWNTDKWNGDSSEDNFLSGEQFANRGENAFTINSADSFVWFVNLTQNETEAAKYNFFKDYTIYLNTNIDLQNKPTEQIGKKMSNGESTFQGTFDGAYYTIINAKLSGGLFAYTTNATIKNIGLYNAEIQSNNEYTGGIVDEAIDTTISDVYVRVGRIKGNNVGGIVGKLTLTQNNSITNSFADTTLNGTNNAGLIYEINGTNITEENANNQIINCTIDYCYFTNAEKQIALLKNANLQTLHILANPVLSNFNAWNYKAEYSLKTTWCNYSGNKNFSFNLPILSKFNKTFIYGCYYENVLVKENGEVENLESLSTAFNTMKDGDTAELNLIVEKITVAEPAILTANATLHLESAVNTTLTRGENNTQTLIASGNNSKLEIGGKSNTTITLEGNREYVEANNLKSDAAIIASGEDFTMNNVKVQNNINNSTCYGGGVFVYNVTAGQIIDEETNEPQKLNLSGEITNCESANCGGGLAVVGCASNMGVEISNCKANNGGGLAIVEEIENPSQVNNVFFNYGFDKKINLTGTLTATGTQTVTGTTTITSDIYDNNVFAYGGGVFVDYTGTQAITITLKASVYNNSATSGGGVYTKTGTIGFLAKFYLENSSAKVYSNSAMSGGGIYATYTAVYMNSGSYVGGTSDAAGNTAQAGGGIYLGTNSSFTMSGGKISYNKANTGTASVNGQGGGIYASSDSSISVTGGTISYNTAKNNGGGIYARSDSTISVTSGTISYNTAAKNGGGVYASFTTSLFTDATSNTILEYNTANQGGGIYLDAGSSTSNIGKTSGTKMQVKNNTANDIGGGIYVDLGSSSKVNLNYVNITSNTAKNGGGVGCNESDSTSAVVNITSSCTVDSNKSTSGYSFNTYGFISKDDSYTLYYNTGSGTSSKTVTVNYLDSPSLYTEFKLPNVGSYEYYGWATSASSSTTTSLTTKNTNNSTSYTRYAVYRQDTGTRTSTSSSTVKFYYGSGTSDYISQKVNKTTTYKYVPQYYDYKLSYLSKSSSGGTASGTTTDSIRDPDPSDVPHPSNLDSSFTLYGWNKSKTSKASSSVDVTAGTSFVPDATAYYAVWKAENYIVEEGSRTIYFYYSEETPIEVEQQSTKNYSKVYANYLGSFDLSSLSGNLVWLDIDAPTPTTENEYSFMGWVTDSTQNSYNNSTIQAETSFVPSQTSYYATWYKETQARSSGWQDTTGKSVHLYWQNENEDVSTVEMKMQLKIDYAYKEEYFNYNKSSAYTTQLGGGETSTYKGSVVLPTINEYEHKGYNLLQWHLNSADGEIYALGATYEITTNILTDINFYAEWKAKTYTVILNLAGGECKTDSPIYATFDLEFTIENATRVGYTFAGWTASGLFNNALAGGAVWSGSRTTATTFKNLIDTEDSITLTAEWTVKQYQINKGGKNGEVLCELSTNDYDKPLNFSWQSNTETGYVFKFEKVVIYEGTTNSGTELFSYSGADLNTTFNMSSNEKSNNKYCEEIFIYVSYEKVEINYNIILDYGYQGKENSQFSAKYDRPIEITNPTRTGYKFTGFTATISASNAKYGIRENNLSSWNGSLTTLTAEQTSTWFINLCENEGDSITIVANWNVLQYTIKIKTENGKITSISDSQQFNYDDDVKIDYANNARIGYKYPNPAALTIYKQAEDNANILKTQHGGTSITFNMSTLTDINNNVGYYYDIIVITLHYDEIAISYNIDYQLNNGNFNGVAKKQATYDQAFEILQPTKEGYEFLGWTSATLGSTAQAGSTQNDLQSWNGEEANVGGWFINLTTQENVTVTLIANWQPLTYTITSKATNGNLTVGNSGTFDQPISINFSSEAEPGYTYTFISLTIYAGEETTHSEELSQLGEKPNPATWTMSTKYYPSIYIELIYESVLSNRTLTAHANGGIISADGLDGWQVFGETAKKSLVYGNEYGELPTATRTGYVFDGWFTNLTDGELVKETTTITEDTTIYAHWRLDLTDKSSFVISYDSSIVYTGKAITPTDLHLTITYKSTTVLTENDYKVVAENENVNVTNNASIIIEGKGNYASQITLSFSITPKDINSADIQIDDLKEKFVYTGEYIRPKLTIHDTTREVVLQEDEEYSLDYADNQDASTELIKATITIKGINNYGETRTYTFEIEPRDITNAEITLNKKLFTYNAQAQTPTITVKLSGELISSTDYDVSYLTSSSTEINADEIINVGVYTVVVTGIKNAKGVNKTATFEIVPLNLKGEDVHVVFNPSNLTLTYNRNVQAPSIQSITIGSYSLSLASDILTEIYAVSETGLGNKLGQGAIDAGNYYLVIKSNGKNYLIGEYKAQFTINPASLIGATVELNEYSSEFDNTQKDIQVLSVTTNAQNNSLKLIYNEDINSSEYTIEYSRSTGENDLVNVGTINIIIKANNKNFSGSVTATYNITPADINAVNKPTIANVTFNRKQQEPDFTLTYKGFTLVKDVDFTVTYKNNTNAGFATIEISALSNYVETAKRCGNFENRNGNLILTFTIETAEIDKLELSKTEGNYNQKAHSIGIAHVLANSLNSNETLTLNPNEYKIEYYRYNGQEVDYSKQTTDFISAGKIVVKVVPNEDLVNVNFSGSAIAEYEIKKVDLTTIELSQYIFTYNTKAQHPTSIIVKAGALTLSREEYSIAYYRDGSKISNFDTDGSNADFINAGEIEIRITLTDKGKINHNGELTSSYVIDRKNITDVEIEIKYYYVNAAGEYVDDGGHFVDEKVEWETNQIYVGQLVRPELRYMSGDIVLETLKWSTNEETKNDYSYLISMESAPEKADNFSHVGNYLVTTTGNGNYTGVKKDKYSVSAASLTAKDITAVINPAKYNYTGKPIEVFTINNPAEPTPEEIEAIAKIVNITYSQSAGQGKTTTLYYGEDYVLYTGYFDYHLIETDDGLKPAGKVDDNLNDTTIYITNGYQEGDNVDIGLAYLYLEGKNNFLDVISVPFEIVPAELTKESLTIDYTKNFIYNGFEYKPEPTIKWNDITLEKGMDYSLDYTNNLNVTTQDTQATINVHCLENSNFKFDDFNLPFTISQHNINDTQNIEIKGNSNYEYNGETQHPTLVIEFTSTPIKEQIGDEIQDKTFTLQLSTDYSISYKCDNLPIEAQDAKNAGHYTIVIEGMGNFTGTREVEFEITKRLVTTAELEETNSTFDNTNKLANIVLKLTDTYGQNVAEIFSNFEVKYLKNGVETIDFTNAGTITIEISNKEKSNYVLNETITLTYTINQLDLNQAELQVNIENKEFNGTKFEPSAEEFSLMFGEYKLELDKDFEILGYGENTSKTDLNGTAYVLVNGLGNFKNNFYVYFKIVGVNLDSEENSGRIKIDGTTKNDYKTKQFTYDAKIHKYTPQISVDDVELVEGQDITIAYYRFSSTLNNFEEEATQDFTNVGRIKIVITGINNYSDSFEIEYLIIQKNIAENGTTINSNVKSNYTYTSENLSKYFAELSADSLTIQYTANEETATFTLNKDADYTVRYFINGEEIELQNIINAGNYSILISGINNFTGEYRINFVVDKLKIENPQTGLPENFTIEIQTYTYKNEQFNVEDDIVVKYKSTEIPSDSYTINIEPSPVYDAKTYKLTIVFNQNSNFEGVLTYSFEVQQADITEVVGLENIFDGDKNNYTYVYSGANVLELIKNNLYMFADANLAKLVVNTDFTITTLNTGFTNVGNYSLTIVGKGNYKNELTINFEITKLNVENLNPENQNLEIIVPEYTYEEGVSHNVEDDLRVEFNGKIVDKSEYTVTIEPEDVTDAGEYKVTVEFKPNSNFEGNLSTNFTVKKQILSFEISLTKRDYFEQELLKDILENDLIISGNYNKETLSNLGTLTFDAVQQDNETKLQAGEQKIYWTFTPFNKNYETLTGNYITINALKIELSSIKIKSNGNIIEKLTYTAYDSFDDSKLSLLIYFNNGEVIEKTFAELKSNSQFTSSITLTDGKLTIDSTSLKVFYSENNVTKLCTIAIEVLPIELTLTASNLDNLVEGISSQTLIQKFKISTVVNAYLDRLSYLSGSFKFYKNEQEQPQLTSGDYVAKYIIENNNFKINEQENRIEFYIKPRIIYGYNNILYAVCETGFEKGIQLNIQILTNTDAFAKSIRENNPTLVGEIKYVYVITFVDNVNNVYTPSGNYRIFFNIAAFKDFNSYKLIQDEDMERIEEMNGDIEYIEVFANSVGSIVICGTPTALQGGIRWLIFFIILIIVLIVFIIFLIERFVTKRKREHLLKELNQENWG